MTGPIRSRGGQGYAATLRDVPCALVTIIDTLLRRLPGPLRGFLLDHSELVKFSIVGGVTFLIDNAVWYSLKFTILPDNPTTAKAIGVLVATIASYIFNREWSFRMRAGRERPHEAALFFSISGVALVVNITPLYFSRYVLDLETPYVSTPIQEVADFVSGSVVGVVAAMLVRFWALRKWAFPEKLDSPRRHQSAVGHERL